MEHTSVVNNFRNHLISENKKQQGLSYTCGHLRTYVALCIKLNEQNECHCGSLNLKPRPV